MVGPFPEPPVQGGVALTPLGSGWTLSRNGAVYSFDSANGARTSEDLAAPDRNRPLRIAAANGWRLSPGRQEDAIGVADMAEDRTVGPAHSSIMTTTRNRTTETDGKLDEAAG